MGQGKVVFKARQGEAEHGCAWTRPARVSPQSYQAPQEVTEIPDLCMRISIINRKKEKPSFSF